MAFREPTPHGAKGDDNLPLLVLPRDTLLKGVYRVESYLESGGMSMTYCAVKEGEKFLVKEAEASDPRKVQALKQEKSILERLNHPGLVKVFDLFEHDGFSYLVMEFIDGENLDRLTSPFPDVFLQEKVIIDWAGQLCEIFEYLHEQHPPVIYRDLKPRNLIKDRNGRIHLIDFGIARLFKEGRSKDTESMGTALTASPEHYGGAQTDARSDIFTIGATLHYLVTNGKGCGEEPFEFAPVSSINPKISRNLEKVIRKALELDPARRYQTAKELHQALLTKGIEPLQADEPPREEKHMLVPVKESSSDQEKKTQPAGRMGLSTRLLEISVFMVCILVVVIGVITMNKILAPRLERDGSHTVYDARRSGLSSLTTSPLGSPLPHEGTLMPGGYGTGPPQPSKETNQAKDLPSPTSTITGSLLSPEGSKIISSQTWSPSETQPLPPTPESGVLPRKTGSGHNAGTSISGSPGSSTYGPPPDDLISPGIRRSPDPFVIPTITPGEQIRDTLTGSTRIYRDERHNFRILLHPGWVEDNLIVGREERSGNRLTCGFSHLIHSSPGESEPDCIILIKIEESRPGAAEPLRELILWLERDKKIGQRLDLVESPRVIKNDLALAKVIFSVSEGSDFPQLRVVQEGNSGFVAYIKAQSLVKIEPHKDAAQRIMREDAESVVKSFEFISP